MHRVQFLRPSWGSGWGLGWATWERGGKTVNGHSGWIGGNRTQIMFIPADKVGVIVLTNSDDGEPSFLARHILDYMGPEIVDAFTSEHISAKSTPHLEKYVGTYMEPGPYYTQILIKDQGLIMSTLSFPPEDNPGSEVIELQPEGKNTFRMTGDNGSGELLIFEYDDSRTILRVKVGSNFIYPEARYNLDR